MILYLQKQPWSLTNLPRLPKQKGELDMVKVSNTQFSVKIRDTGNFLSTFFFLRYKIFAQEGIENHLEVTLLNKK